MPNESEHESWGLVKSFDIDNGELDGMTPQECFVLGYELAEVDYMLQDGGPVLKIVHAENRDRLIKSCQDLGRECFLTWMEGDSSESWMMLEVK